MRKTVLAAGLLLAVVSIGLAKVDIPLKQVVLFTSGVGYFERAGSVSDSASAELTFTADRINDVIKSLVLIDESGGTISAVTYDSRDPVERSLESFRVNLGDNPGLPALLNRMRGVQVRVGGGGKLREGRITGVETKTVPAPDGQGMLGVGLRDVLTLMGAEGLYSVDLETVQGIEVMDPEITRDMQKALEVLAASHVSGRKGVRLGFAGKGQRQVRVGYMMEMPLWRTSYRLVIKDTTLFLQGWAHVENTTDEDWNQVKLSLVSGRPLSFVQNLYDPLYIQRPVVEEDTGGGIVPPAYESAVQPKKAYGAAWRAKGEGYAGEAVMMDSLEQEMAPAAAPAPMQLGRGAGVVNQAAGREAGELFEYAIRDAVTLPRQQSAMIPIVNEDIKGEPLSIFNESVNARNPLNGVEIDNTSKQHLMHGPVTVFEGGIYAGDGRLADTRPGEKKLLSYAVDLACEVKKERDAEPEEIVSMKIVHGALFLERKYVDITKYTVNNKRGKKRQVMIEHPARHGWDVIEPQVAPEKTMDVFRFRLWADPEKSLEFIVKERRIGQQTVGLANLDDRTIGIYLNQRVISRPVRDALEKLAGLQRELAKVRVQREAIEKRIQAIAADQGRIRQNMQTVTRGSENYTRWENKLSQQEDELEQITGQLDRLQSDERLKQNEIDNFIAALNAE